MAQQRGVFIWYGRRVRWSGMISQESTMLQRETEHVPKIPTSTTLVKPSLVGHIFHPSPMIPMHFLPISLLEYSTWNWQWENRQLEVVGFPSRNRRDCGRAMTWRLLTSGSHWNVTRDGWGYKGSFAHNVGDPTALCRSVGHNTWVFSTDGCWRPLKRGGHVWRSPQIITGPWCGINYANCPLLLTSCGWLLGMGQSLGHEGDDSYWDAMWDMWGDRSHSGCQQQLGCNKGRKAGGCRDTAFCEGGNSEELSKSEQV